MGVGTTNLVVPLIVPQFLPWDFLITVSQCRIIRGTELASVKEQLQQLVSRQQELYSRLGPQGLLDAVQGMSICT